MSTESTPNISGSTETGPERLRQIRRRLSLTQKGFAALLGVSEGHLAHLEVGRSPISRRFAERVTGVTGVRSEWLLGGTGDCTLAGELSGLTAQLCAWGTSHSPEMAALVNRLLVAGKVGMEDELGSAQPQKADSILTGNEELDEVIRSAWIVLQHGSEEIREEMLEMMVVWRNHAINDQVQPARKYGAV